LLAGLTREFRRIRRLQHDDVPRLMAWDNDPELFQLTGKKFRHDDKEETWWHRLQHDRSRLAFAIVDDEGQLIGDVAFEQIGWRAREAEIRISIGDKRYWNRGYGTEALQEALWAAFHELSLNRVYLRVRADNSRAIRTYEKVGFRTVGRLQATGRLERYTDLHLMEVTEAQYRALMAKA
jgi:RimJ/RimL family protein N-acetyltransferase